MDRVGAAGARQAADNGWVASGAGFAQAAFRKSSWSTFNGNCVAVAALGNGLVGVRDTKDGEAGPVLVFGSQSWRSFLVQVRNDLLA